MAIQYYEYGTTSPTTGSSDYQWNPYTGRYEYDTCSPTSYSQPMRYYQTDIAEYEVVIVTPKNWRWYLQFFKYLDYVIFSAALVVALILRRELRMFSGIERRRRKRRMFVQSLRSTEQAKG